MFAARCGEAETLSCRHEALPAGNGGARESWETKCEESAAVRCLLRFPSTRSALPAWPVLFS